MPSVDVSARRSLPPACSLGPDDGRERLLRWQALRESADPRATLHPGRLEVVYRGGSGVRDELRALAAAEQACCAFATWAVVEVDGQPVLVVTAPEGTPEAVEPVAALFGATRHDDQVTR